MRHPGLRPKGHLTGLGFRRFHAPNAILELHNRLTQQAHRKSSTFPTAKPRPLAPQDKIEPKIAKPQWAHVPACRCQPCQPCQPYKYMMKTSQQWTHKVPSYPFCSKQFGESLEHWTDSSVAVALKAKVDPTCLQSLVKLCRDRKLLFEEMYLAHHDHFHGRDHCSPHFTVWPWRRWPLGPSNGYIMIHIFIGKTLTVSYSQWISQRHTLMAFAGHGMAILAFFFRPVSLHSGN